MAIFDGSIKMFSTREALTAFNEARGRAYFIPDGFLPILVRQADVTDEVRTKIRRSCAHLYLSGIADDCRLPTYVIASRTKTTIDPVITKEPPRPPNAFILYRKDKQSGIAIANLGITNNDISRIIGQMWRNETESVRQQYQALAERVKAEHRIKFPNYKYSPKRPKKASMANNEELACQDFQHHAATHDNCTESGSNAESDSFPAAYAPSTNAATANQHAHSATFYRSVELARPGRQATDLLPYTEVPMHAQTYVCPTPAYCG